MSATSATKSVDSIFNFGSVLDRLAGTAINAVETVAPVWLEQQLKLDRYLPTDYAQTYNGNDPQRQPPTNLTTTGGNNQGVVLSNNTLLMVVAAGILGVVVLMNVAD